MVFKPTLTPAYDYVSTIPYIPEDGLALNFIDSKKFSSLSLAQFSRFAGKSGLPQEIVLNTVIETVKKFKSKWELVDKLGLDPRTKILIENHIKSIPLYREIIS